MTSLISKRHLLIWRNRADGSPVGRRNATVAAVRNNEPSRPKQPGRRYGPAVRPAPPLYAVRDEATSGHTHIDTRRHAVRNALGRFVRRES